MNNMNYFDITVTRGSGGFGLSLIYRGLDKFPAPETGIFVARVVPGGHSHRAGLQENDKVLKINKREPRDVNDAVAIIKKAGKTLVISVGRKQPDILNNQGEPHLVPTIHIQKPLSRSGSARSLNTSIIQGQSPVRSHTPFNSDVNQQQRFLQQQQQQQQQQYAQQQYEQQLAQQQYEDQQRQQQEQLQRQQQEQLLRQQQEQLQRQQQEQLDREQLERERAAIAAENRRIHAQQLELQRQKEELRKAQELQNQQIPDKSRYGTAAGSTGQLVSDILSGAGLPRGDLSRARSLSRAAVYTTDSSDEEEEAAGNKFIRNRRSKSVDGRRNRAKSPGSLSGISFHDLSELSTVSKMSRFEEKDHMQGLNNRLAGYIDKVRQLQTENTRMTKQVEYIEESQMKELGSIKHLYDKEVNDLKNAIDSLARSYRELQGNSDKVLQTNRELKTKVNRKASDVKANNDKILGLKEELAKIRSRVNAAEKDKGKVAAKLNDVLPEVDRVQEKISETLYQLGDIRKVNKDLEEQTGKLSLELKDKMARMDTTLEEVKVRKQMEVIEISGKLEKEYESRVQNALASLREVYENQVKEGRDEFNRKYEERVEELQSKLSKERFNNSSTGQNVEETNRRVSALISKVSNLEDERTRLSDKLNQLERRLRDQQANQNIQMKGKDDEIRKLMAEINKNMEDYQNLLHVKTALDMEIAVYRKLVESEEDRLGIDVTETGSQSLPSSRGCSSPSSPITRTTLFKSQHDNYSRKVTHNQTQL